MSSRPTIGPSCHCKGAILSSLSAVRGTLCHADVYRSTAVAARCLCGSGRDGASLHRFDNDGAGAGGQSATGRGTEDASASGIRRRGGRTAVSGVPTSDARARTPASPTGSGDAPHQLGRAATGRLLDAGRPSATFRTLGLVPPQGCCRTLVKQKIPSGGDSNEVRLRGRVGR
jgi:hypothetical protein